MKTLYATKMWGGDAHQVFSYHPKPDLVIANNLGFKIVDIGETADCYYKPELQAILQAHKLGYDYILWYASDVKPPAEDWTEAALPLLDKYPMVSPFWESNFDDYVRMMKQQERCSNEVTDFGFADQFFSDQAYFAKVETMLKIDYDTEHSIRQYYPQHGGNSFECRIAQWLANTNQLRAVLRDFSYRHTTRDEK